MIRFDDRKKPMKVKEETGIYLLVSALPSFEMNKSISTP